MGDASAKTAAEEKLIDEADRYLADLGISAVGLTVPIGRLIALIGFAQLGLRHPSAAAAMPSSTNVRALLEEVIIGLDPRRGPLFDLLMKGFDPNFDVMRPAPPPRPFDPSFNPFRSCLKCGAMLRGPKGYGCEICGARDE